MEEWAIINGDSSLGNGLQFDGLMVQTTSNEKPNAGVTLALSDITDVAKRVVSVGGKPQMVVMSYRDLVKFNDLVLSGYYRLFQAGAGTLADVPAGVSITRWVSPFGTVDIIGTRYIVPDGADEDTILVLDDKTILEDGNAIQMVKNRPSINSVNSVKGQKWFRPSQARKGRCRDYKLEKYFSLN